MEAFITALFPVSIPLWQALGLVFLSFFTSFLSASAGIGGGTAMMGVMAGIMPVNVLVATHALVQLGSNGGRAVLQRAHILWPIVIRLTLGGVAGAIAGGLLFVNLPAQVLMLVVAVFILWMVWGPKFQIPGAAHWGLMLAGAFATFCGMFIGSMGPFINALLQRRQLERQQIIATQAASLVFQRIVKISVFLALGVQLREWVGMIALMIITGFAGTYVGTYVLTRIPEHLFQVILKIILTLSALSLLYESASIWLSL